MVLLRSTISGNEEPFDGTATNQALCSRFIMHVYLQQPNKTILNKKIKDNRPLSDDDINILYDSGVLGVTAPQALLNTV